MLQSFIFSTCFILVRIQSLVQENRARICSGWSWFLELPSIANKKVVLPSIAKKVCFSGVTYFIPQYGGPHQQHRNPVVDRWSPASSSRSFQSLLVKRPAPRNPSPSRDDCPNKRSKSISSHQASALFP